MTPDAAQEDITEDSDDGPRIRLAHIVSRCIRFGMTPWETADAILAHIRQHPEDAGLRAFTESEHARCFSSVPKVPYVVIPDPEPQDEPLPTVDGILILAREVIATGGPEVTWTLDGASGEATKYVNGVPQP